jgi:hypothetical protein
MLLLTNSYDTYMITPGDLVKSQASLDVFTNSGWDGVAYLGDHINNSGLATLRTNKHLWGWCCGPMYQTSYDFTDTHGMYSRMLAIWRSALETAVRMGSPGIAVDLEPYGAPDELYTDTGAALHNMDAATYMMAIQKIGVDLVDIVAEVFPNVIVWSTGMLLALGRERYSIRHISQAMLDRALELGIPALFIEGSGSIGYIRPSLIDCATVFQDWINKCQWAVTQYPNLRLGASFVFWNKLENTSQWLNTSLLSQQSQGILKVHSMADQHALLAWLSDHFDYIWVYHDTASDYRPFANEDAESRLPFENALRGLKYRERIKLQWVSSSAYDSGQSLVEFDKQVGKGCRCC